MRKKIATLPRLVEAKNGDWYVYFQVRDAMTDQMRPQKVYRGFKQCRSVREKRAWGESLVKEYTDKLQSGWTPLDEREQVIYSDNVAYAQVAERFNVLRRSTRNHHFYLSQFLSEEKLRLRANTYKTYQSKMRIYNKWLDENGYGDFDVSAVDNGIVKRFFAFVIEHMKLDRLTVEKYVQILRRFYDFLAKQDKIKLNPVHAIILPQKRADKAARPINKADLKDMLRVIREHDPQLYLSCMFMYYLSVRPGTELRLLRIKDLDLYNSVVTIVDGQAKNQRRTVDMPKQLKELCEAYMLLRYNREYFVFGRFGVPGPEATGKNTLRCRFNRMRDGLNLPKTYKYYSMKHTGGGALLSSGATIEEIRDHMGHKNIETTDRYLRRHFGNRNRKVIHDFPSPEE